MKQLFILVLALLLTVSLLNANEKTSDEQRVNLLVEKVKQSKGDERRKAMNALKVQLRSMNQNTRQKVMLGLQKEFAAKQPSHSNKMKRNSSQKSFSSPTGMQKNSPHHSITSMPHKTQQIPSQHFRKQGGHK